MGPKDISSYTILASKDKMFLEKIFRHGKLQFSTSQEYLYIIGYSNIWYSDREVYFHI